MGKHRAVSGRATTRARPSRRDRLLSEDLAPRSLATSTAGKGNIESWYEQHKRGLAVAVLPERHYRRVFEPGCGGGELSELLAPRCDELLCWDADPTCAAMAAARLADAAHVHVARATLPAEWPGGTADLIVLSEVGCHLRPDDLDAVLARCAASLDPGGVLLAVHSRAPMPHYPAGGDDVHARLFGLRGLARRGGYTDDSLRIDIFERPAT